MLVVVAIIAAMVTVSVVSLRAGQGAVRVRGAARDVFAVIRHARSVALVSQEPSIITYECHTVAGVAQSSVKVYSAKMLVTGSRGKPETLSGEPVKVSGDEVSAAGSVSATASDDGKGIVEDVLFAPISEDILTGIRVKVTMGDELLATQDAEEMKRRANKISVFSNIDYRLGKFDDWKKAEEEKKSSAEPEASAAAADGNDDQPIVKVQWETNGRCDPHRVWIYPDGAEPESGLVVKIDRFGAASVISPGEEDEK